MNRAYLVSSCSASSVWTGWFLTTKTSERMSLSLKMTPVILPDARICGVGVHLGDHDLLEWVLEQLLQIGDVGAGDVADVFVGRVPPARPPRSAHPRRRDGLPIPGVNEVLLGELGDPEPLP